VIIDIEQDRLLVVSDLHIGNPYSAASRNLGAFFEYARRGEYNVCINGDGFEILQARFASLAADSMGVLHGIRRLIESGREVFYVVGNHDIALENFLSAWSGIQITPFLNVTSGAARIRIEHGHLYDPSFVKSPRLYEWLTRAAGPFLHFYPDVYRLWTSYEIKKQRLRRALRGGRGERSVYHEAARMLLRRGFDVVVFGHTHHAEDVSFEPEGRYLNSGNWVQGGSFVEIERGQVALRRWGDRDEDRAVFR
jgi:UDP-2,3-diacylglucosamine pyrophosphatase LpxH